MNEDTNIKLHERIGGMQSDVKNIGRQMEKVVNKVETIDNRLIQLNTSTVKQDECTQRTRIFTEKMGEIKNLLSTKQTRPDNMSLNKLLSLEKDTLDKKSFLIKVKDNITAILAIFTLLGIIVGGGIKFAHFIVKMETVMKTSEEQTVKTTREIKNRLEQLRKMGRKTQQSIMHENSMNIPVE